MAISRAENKLADATSAFSYDFRGKVVLDIGSSTGGFTNFALSKGAKKVIAIEKGTRQMKSPLRANPRVELYEKTDIFYVAARGHMTMKELLPLRPRPITIIDQPDVILADVSFVSLRKVLSYAKRRLATSSTDFLVMLKPQFEARPSDLHNGVVKNEHIRREIIKSFEFWLKEHNFHIIKKHDNTLAGKNGNRERFYYISLDT